MEAQLSDWEDRARIERALQETLFVEAGAGTGKTHQLVERMVNLIATGRVRGAGVAAITFTEKAAAELRDRVLERLEEESEVKDDLERMKRCQAALEELDGAAIETIHAFAARVLSLFPLEAGLPPGFEIADDTESRIELADRWHEALDAMLEDLELDEPLRNAFDAGLTFESLAGVVRKVHEDWDRVQSEESVMECGFVETDSFVSDLQSVIDTRRACVDPDDRLYRRLQDLEGFADRLREAAGDRGKFVKLLEHSTATSLRVGNMGRRGSWVGETLGEIRQAMATLHVRREQLRLEIVRCIFAPIYNAIRAFVLDYADERRRRGRLGFQDLLVRCRTLLHENPEVAARVRERFGFVLIDEFHDTDPLQSEIADAIAGDEEGRLFFVGDPKQSIYRFRRADIDQYRAIRERYSGSLVHLTQNFRSQPGVTNFVNAVFGPLMRADSTGGQAVWEDLNAYRGPLECRQAPGVVVIGDEMNASTSEVRRVEAQGLAQIIAGVRESQWPVFDQSSKCWRAARFSDVAVLVPARTGLSQILPELDERDIPYRLESRSLVFRSEEVRRLLDILQAIDDPTDEVALVGSLRASAFACSDVDLLAWRESGGRWDYRAVTPEGIPDGHPVADAMRWFRDTALAQWRMSVSALVERVISERRLMELAVVDRRPRDRWQRLRFLLDQARSFGDQGGRTLNEFLRWAQHQAEEDTRVIESVVPESDHDAVRILTIHAAKGLEFPVVVLAGLNVRSRDERPALLWRADKAPELHLREGLKTPGYDELFEQEVSMQRAERVRLNYVAATRARDHLVVSLYRKQGGNLTTDAHVIADQLDQLGDSQETCLFSRISPEQSPPLPQRRGEGPTSDRARRAERIDTTGTASDREQWLEERGAAIRAHANFDVRSATNLARRAGLDDPNIEKDERPDDLPPWRRGRGGTSVGRAVHSALQTIDIEAADDFQISAVATAQSAAEGLDPRYSADVARLVRVALDSSSLRDAVASDRYWREVYVAAPILDDRGRAVLVEGFIDLMYQTSDGDLIVVDYKTDALPDGEAVDQALAHYEPQGATYALALEESLGRRVTACKFLFLHANQERSVPNLATAVARIRETLHETGVG
ncbi:MAG: UvrD-helicase domain-containing protein [Chloroflexota bacterium]|nr:UvrD-helicase domain-containing protein [Chloroflexota bacterium]